MKTKTFKLIKKFILASLLFNCMPKLHAENSVKEQILIGVAVQLTVQVTTNVTLKLLDILLHKLTKDEQQEFIDAQKEGFAIGNTNPDDPNAQILLKVSTKMYTLAALDKEENYINKRYAKEPTTKEKLLAQIKKKQAAIISEKYENEDDQEEN